MTVGLSVLLHGLLAVGILVVPRFQVGTYLKVPVSYTVNLVDAPPGGAAHGGPSPAPAAAPTPPPAQAAPTPRSAPVPAARPAPRPTEEELTLPGRKPVRKPSQEREPTLRPPSVTGRETARPVPPPVPRSAPPAAPAAPQAPVAPQVPAVAPPVASAGTGAGSGAGKSSGVEMAGTAGGGGTGAGGGDVLASYLTRVDWKIQENWVPVTAAGAPELLVVVRFRVLRSGQVRDVELESSSGNASVDTSALRAIRQSMPLPPFPNLLTEPFLDLRYRFVMERG